MTTFVNALVTGASSGIGRAISLELARRGARQPGFVDTPLTRKNRFAMPFMKDVDQAARIIARGLERGTPVVAFPWQLESAMKVAELIPDALWRPIARRLPR